MMNDLRTAFDEYVPADEPPMGLTSGSVLAAARRSRRLRLAGGAAGITAAMVAVTLALAPAIAGIGGRSGLAVAAADPVDTAAVIEAAVLAWAPDPDDLTLDTIYPSDWTRTSALPSGQEANATEWHGSWSLPGGQKLWVSMMYLGSNWHGLECEPPNCEIDTDANGRMTMTDVYFLNGSTNLIARHQRTEGFNVLVWVEAPGESFFYTKEQLLELAMDPALTFPYPAATPTGTPLELS